MEKTLIFAILLILCPHIALAEEMPTQAYLPWSLNSQKIIYVLVNSESEITENKKAIINAVIMSDKSIRFYTQHHFEGWQGALNQIDYADNLPVKLVFTDNEKSENMILINLKDESSEFDGFTTYDLNQNKITKSYVAIYNSKNLTDEDFEKILRHEFGHSLGLAHSQNINDVMFNIIPSSNPYISDADIFALSFLF